MTDPTDRFVVSDHWRVAVSRNEAVLRS